EDVPCRAPPPPQHEPTRDPSVASQLLIIECCDHQLNPPHHRRFIRRPAATVAPIDAIERLKIHRAHRVQHKPGQVPRRQPLTHVGRHQKRLITITRDETLSHHTMVLNPPDDIPTYATASGISSGA